MVVVAHILTIVTGRAKWYLIETEDKNGQDYTKGDEKQGCRLGNGKFLKVGEKWTNKKCETYICNAPDRVFGLVPPVWSCEHGEKRVDPQYPECSMKCVPDKKDDKEINEGEGDDTQGCRDPRNSLKFYKVGEKWTDEDCIVHTCEEHDIIGSLPPAQFRCADGEKAIQPQYPECGGQKCVTDNEGYHGNNEDDGLICSEGKYPNGTCRMYEGRAYPPDS